jgi:hypothetical protein
MIVDPAPPPPPLVRHALDRLAAARRGDPADLVTLGELARPWDPATCGPPLRTQIWAWCELFAAWINRTYGWRPTQLIPACWPHHPHVAAELPVLACLRVAAEDALSPDPLDEWHRNTLPLFFDRLADRVGDATCRTGTHTAWPAAARDATYHSEVLTADRAARLAADTNPDAADPRTAPITPLWQRLNLGDPPPPGHR